VLGRLGSVQLPSPGGVERLGVHSDRLLERLVVRAPRRVRPDELDHRVLAMDPDQEVDGGHALGVREREPLVRRRELAGEPLQRNQRSVRGGTFDRAAVLRPVALGQVGREALVQPARREVVRVVHRRVEHEVDQLVGNDDINPRVVDLARRDQREERPDLGVRLAADVLARGGPEGVVELLLVGVDEEIDRVVLRDPEQLRRLGDGALADLERTLAERLGPGIPVDADDLALARLPVEPAVLVGDGHGRAGRLAAVIAGHPPARGQGGVRQDVPGGQLERVPERRPAARGAGNLFHAGAEPSGRLDQDLEPCDARRQGRRLLEHDPLAIARGRLGVAPRDVDGAHGTGDERRDDQQRERERGRDRRPARDQSAHASPASRRDPSPFSCAPSRPSRASAQPGPWAMGTTGTSRWTISSARS
jgi:hypothetical protein